MDQDGQTQADLKNQRTNPDGNGRLQYSLSCFLYVQWQRINDETTIQCNQSQQDIQTWPQLSVALKAFMSASYNVLIGLYTLQHDYFASFKECKAN